jgi:hypothetical protein
MAETATKPTLLQELTERRDALGKEWGECVDAREAERAEFEGRQKAEKEEERPSDSDVDAFRVAEEEFKAEIADFENRWSELNDRVLQLRGKAEREAIAVASTGAIARGSAREEAVYHRGNAHEFSYFRDLLITEPSWKSRIAHDWTHAEERIRRHGREMEDVLERRDKERTAAAESGIDRSEREFRASFPGLSGTIETSPFESRANPSRQTGAGGEFVPPLWLVEDDWIPLLRAGRVVAPLCRNLAVPPGTDTIKLPKVKVGTEVAPQLMDNAGVASRDVETTFVEAPIKTLAGQEDVAIQLIEQSPGQVFDRVVQEDLLADYNLKVEQNVIFAPGTNVTQLNAGTILGLLPAKGNWEGQRNKAEEPTEFTAASFVGAMSSNWGKIALKRFNVQNVHHIAFPSRVALFAGALDAAEGKSGRPLVESPGMAHFNIAAQLESEGVPAEGAIARTPLGPVIYQTANIAPTISTEGWNKEGEKSTSEKFDTLLTAKFDDVWFFESDLRARVLPEVASGTLQVRYQVYAYVGLLVRYGPSLVQACGKAFEKLEAKGKSESGKWEWT